MFFFDTYAIMALIEGLPAYKKYAEETIFTSKLNIGELYHILLRRHGKATADYWVGKLDLEVVDFTTETVIKAMLFKYKYNKRNFSVFDVIGYTLAIEKGFNFLTGDQQFKDLENVEFVK